MVLWYNGRCTCWLPLPRGPMFGFIKYKNYWVFYSGIKWQWWVWSTKHSAQKLYGADWSSLSYQLYLYFIGPIFRQTISYRWTILMTDTCDFACLGYIIQLFRAIGEIKKKNFDIIDTPWAQWWGYCALQEWLIIIIIIIINILIILYDMILRISLIKMALMIITTCVGYN